MITIRTGMTIGGTSQEPISSTFLMPRESHDSEGSDGPYGSKAVVHRLGVLAIGQERDGTVRIAASCGNPSADLVDGRHGSTEMDCRAVPATFGNEMLDECAVALRDPPLLTLSRSMTPRCLFDLWGSWQIRESNSRCSPAEPSGKVPDTHSVDSICDHDFGVFTVTNIATENTDAVLPAHPLPRTPKAANQGLQRCRGPSVPLTCLAPLAAWQSLCTGHVDASLENSVALAFTDGDRPSPAADTSISLASERSPP
jgi:hypothetical protein